MINLSNQLREVARRIAEAAPPLTPDQRLRLRGLLTATEHQVVTR
ncbi:hypothetical protein [Micromonospora humi]|uniref:Uncharacterized protein n=1 Tax=Micromonospora humi TaxID=745366 RepID=A0A1C5K9U7_9ACTN|nr:hypothetical protein [Micromonospora humi]SCG79595.1 hypothetical protein GA0070213_1338 [Micromonospora humi]